ncbi:uncharacterized protein LOC143884706 isoform X1 [Tasmannia lanceolata]|uniref:uncharacterized protein LOC143884683 n=2 Tax=Tasmannia lanceolata TaxID=3420 RepID=UPI0040640EB8
MLNGMGDIGKRVFMEEMGGECRRKSDHVGKEAEKMAKIPVVLDINVWDYPIHEITKREEVRRPEEVINSGDLLPNFILKPSSALVSVNVNDKIGEALSALVSVNRNDKSGEASEDSASAVSAKVDVGGADISFMMGPTATDTTNPLALENLLLHVDLDEELRMLFHVRKRDGICETTLRIESNLSHHWVVDGNEQESLSNKRRAIDRNI